MPPRPGPKGLIRAQKRGPTPPGLGLGRRRLERRRKWLFYFFLKINTYARIKISRKKTCKFTIPLKFLLIQPDYPSKVFSDKRDIYVMLLAALAENDISYSIFPG